MATERRPGWAWFEAPGADDELPQDATLCLAFARCFGGADGEMALDHLRRTFLDRRLPPQASDGELRHLEGQRCAVAHVFAMVERGRSRP